MKEFKLYRDEKRMILEYRKHFFEHLVALKKQSMKEYYEKKINIESIALDLLEELGFDRKDIGSLYLASVIEELFHERKGFVDGNEEFNFDSKNNNHYWHLTEYYEGGFISISNDIRVAKEKSYVKDLSMNEIVYSIVNDIINMVDRDECKKLVYSNEDIDE